MAEHHAHVNSMSETCSESCIWSVTWQWGVSPSNTTIYHHRRRRRRRWRLRNGLAGFVYLQRRWEFLFSAYREQVRYPNVL